MIIAYKEHFQFILILAVLYVLGVWAGPIIYILFPLALFLFGLKGRYFELFIITLWLLILSDYVPVENATHDDLQFAKDLKPLLPLALVGFILLSKDSLRPFPKVFYYFVPFFILASVGLIYSINITVGIQKTISFVLMYFVVPIYVYMLHRKMGDRFWKALMTFIIGMLSIGIVLSFVAPDIAVLKGGRFKGVLGNPNGLGVFLNLTFILWILIREFKLATFTKKENGYILAVILLSLIWCGSRNGMMSVFLFFVMYRFIKINWLLAIVVVLTLVTFNNQIFDFVVTIIEFFGLQDYFRIESIEEGSGRNIAWMFAWQQIQDYYFLGGGFGHDEHVMRPNYHWLARQGHQGGVHNSYLSMWFDSGIVGLVAYFGGLLAIVFRSMKNNYLIIAFLVSILFNITYESWLVGSLNPFTIVLLIILTIFVENLRGDEYLNENEQKTA
jgi:O-antigen ligase